ncbi:MAG: host-nuclease inhibitor Gam family protein [Verrucomicrobia bacterium]|nr:host-nuclease inhibitor Gam family protein [Verrucomicrobiota bacterium]
MTLKITSPESLDTAVADVVRKRIKLTQSTAAKDAEVTAVERNHQPDLTRQQKEIAADEAYIMQFCEANRAGIFPKLKSRETSLAVFGFEMTPPRVETSSRKVTWKDVVARLLKLSWGKAYINTPAPKPDKDALLADREKLTPEQQTAAGIQFCQDEQFYIRPKPETAAETPAQEAA